ncbi:WG repeat-containing protein [Brevibacillus sp. SYSU BS000544]|uniref:WG repeat-containing protein n=1 Tax=Brevibacillus sp. SYSU BS000544 TaxID=3416443 RepID=UPI003CE4BF02
MRKMISLFTLMLLILTGCMNEVSTASTPTAPASQKAPDSQSAATAPAPAPAPTSLYPFMDKQRGGSILWGYIDQEGREIIKPTYIGAEPFNELGYAIVSSGTSVNDYKYGLIDKTGKYVLQPIYEYLNHFDRDLYTATTPDGVKLLKATGEEIVNLKGGTIGELSNGLAVFTQNERSGYLDHTGKTVISAKYKYANPFKEDKTVVVLPDGIHALINKKGEVIQNLTFTEEQAGIQEFREGLGIYADKNSSKYGFIQENGNISIPAQFSGVSPFEHGLSVVELEFAGNKVGLINTKGQFVVPAEYTSITSLKNGLWAVGMGSEELGYLSSAPQSYAIIDSSGQYLTDFIYDMVEPFQGEYAVAQADVSTFFIDQKGKKVDELPAFEGVGTATVMGDVISATIDNRLQYVKRDGKVIWQERYLLDLGSGITVAEAKVRSGRNYLAYYPVIEGMKDKAVQQKINEILKHKVITDEDSSDTETTFDFAIEMQKKDLLVVQINSYSYPYGAAHGMPGLEYKHINLRTGTLFKLKDLFKANSDFVQKLNQQIIQQMKTKGEDLGVFPETLDNFAGITEDQGFYIKDNILHIYFYPYEIGSYAAGFITFPIPLDQLKQIVDTDGEFWKSFQ